MNPALCPVCGDTPEWCPQQNGGKPPTPPESAESAEDRRLRVESEIARSRCGYCDNSFGHHSTHCPRYVKPTRRLR